MLQHLVTLAQLRRQKGLTTVEYVIAGGVIAAGVVGLFLAIGDQVVAFLNDLIDDLGG